MSMKIPSGFEVVGSIGVDAGLCWIGDPCYIIHSTDDNSQALGKNWHEFCDKLKDPSVVAQSFNYPMGHEGLGVCVSTGYGDGVYPVIVKKNKEGTIIEARVIFATE